MVGGGEAGRQLNRVRGMEERVASATGIIPIMSLFVGVGTVVTVTVVVVVVTVFVMRL